MTEPKMDLETPPTLEVIEEPVLLSERRPHPTIYRNTALAGSAVEQEAASNPDRFFNPQLPKHGILHEKPEHRTVILMKARSVSNRDIAKITGYTEHWVAQILKQPWAQIQLLDELRRASGDEIQELLRGAAADSVFEIIKLRDESDDDGVKLRASQDLLDRYLGKATQRVESKNMNMNVSGSVETLDAEIRKLEELEGQLRGLPQAAPQGMQTQQQNKVLVEAKPEQTQLQGEVPIVEEETGGEMTPAARKPRKADFLEEYK